MKFESKDDVIIVESVLYIVQECKWPQLKSDMLELCMKRFKYLLNETIKAKKEFGLIEEQKEAETKEDANK